MQPVVFGTGQSLTFPHRRPPDADTLTPTSIISSGFWDVKAVKFLLAVWLYLFSVCSYENLGKKRQKNCKE